MKLFPLTLMRISGGSIEEIKTLEIKETLEIIEDISKLELKLRIVKAKLIELLYHFIPTIKDHKTQNLILNFKRNIHNDRVISEQELYITKKILRKSHVKYVNEFFRIKERINKLVELGYDGFQKEFKQTRRNLNSLAQNSIFQKGLVLSSQSLLERTLTYLQKDPKHFKKKELQTEQSSLKYLTRMHTKTSPYSTFTNLSMGKIVTKLSNLKSVESNFISINSKGEPAKLSHIRINNFIFEYLLNLFSNYDRIYRHLPLRLNPTLKKETAKYAFLTNNANIESFQRLSVNSVIDLFNELFLHHNGSIIYKDLINIIVQENYIEAPRKDIANYVSQLIEYGLLEFNIGVSGTDPEWDLKLRKVLNPLKAKNKLISELINTLIYLRKLARQFAISDFNERNRILAGAYKRLRKTCMNIHEAAKLPKEERRTNAEMQQQIAKRNKENITDTKDSKTNKANKKDQKKKKSPFRKKTNTYFNIKQEQILYEDVSLEIAPEIDEKKLTALISKMNKLIKEVNLFDSSHDLQDSFVHYFSRKYKGKKQIELVTFYEDYYREIKIPEAKRQKQLQESRGKKKIENNDINMIKKDSVKRKNKKDETQIEIPKIRKRRKLRETWKDHFSNIIATQINSNKDELKISLNQIKKSGKGLDLHNYQNQQASSFGLFVHFFEEKQRNGRKKLVGVCNATIPGFGKMFSRFLHIFDNSNTNELHEWNQTLCRNSLFTENHDASFFNANIHPPLMPFEISMPGSHNMLPQGKQISITDLVCKASKKEGRLLLFHKPTNKQVFVFNLGFEGNLRRSKLFQLLDSFSLIKKLGYYPLISKVNEIYRSANNNSLVNKKESNLYLKDSIKNKKIIYIPRIVFEGQLILQRKTWLIPRECLPFKKRDESNWSFFFRIKLWSKQNNMPDEIFIFINDRQQAVKTNEQVRPRKKIGRDDYKPQYISFNSPLLINLFGKSIERVPSLLRIEEMLPNSKQLFAIGKNKYPVEFVVQWYE